MSNHWTDEQLLAINYRGGDILVSASAGSGKTAVLVERVIRRILDDTNPIPIDKFLIVTYTKAAASEMREKIISALNKVDTDYARSQLILLNSANISTVHSFCKNLIAEYASSLDIDMDFRIGDTKELDILKDKVLENTIEQSFTDIPLFSTMLDKFNSSSDDKNIKKLFLEFYNNIRSRPFPSEDMDEMYLDYLNISNVKDSKWGKFLLEHTLKTLKYNKHRLENIYEEIKLDSAVFKAYGSAISSDILLLENFINIINKGSFDDIVGFSIAREKLGQLRSYEDKEFKELILSIRKAYAKDLDDLKQTYFSEKESEILAGINDITPNVKAFFDFIKLFSENYDKAKRQKNIVDFSDLEHFAIKIILEHKDEIANKFAQVMVDEYQDTNAIQDFIFASISNNNLFMVGDVKQSIYRFRLAQPSIFLDKYLSMPMLPNDKGVGKVILSKNFRSSNQVLDATNLVMQNIMSQEFGGIDYNKDEFLNKGSSYELMEQNNAELHIISSENTDADTDDIIKIQVEANFVVSKISNMINDGYQVFDKTLNSYRDAKAEDFCVITYTKDQMRYFAKTLELANIKSSFETNSGLMENIEIRAIVSLMMAINNPIEDIYLISALRSSLFRFTDDELADIRLSKKGVSFYDALLSMVDCEKCLVFIEFLQDIRLSAIDKPVYELIWEIYVKTDAIAIYKDEYLMQFLTKAREFEQNGFKGLHSFVNLLKRMLEKGEDFSENKSINNSVKLMTIHKSKGLEFPIVFFSGISKRFNMDDTNKYIMLDEKLGFGVKTIDHLVGISSSNIIRDTIALKIRKDSLEESLRVLYVAMTRARQKLIITHVTDNADETILKMKSLELSPYMLSKANSPSKWIIPAILKCPNKFIDVYIENEATPITILKDDETKSENMAITINPEIEYNISRIPQKVIATDIYKDKKISFRKANFDKRKLTASEIGIAHHMFMQVCNFDHCNSIEDIKGEIIRLYDNKMLNHLQAECIIAEHILNFFNSDIYSRLKKSSFVMREYKFSCLLAASEIYEGIDSFDEIMLQGVIDCLFEEDGEIIIIDYKTSKNDFNNIDKYTVQMEIYKKACTKIFDKPCKSAVLYFFASASEVLI